MESVLALCANSFEEFDGCVGNVFRKAYNGLNAENFTAVINTAAWAFPVVAVADKVLGKVPSLPTPPRLFAAAVLGQCALEYTLGEGYTALFTALTLAYSIGRVYFEERALRSEKQAVYNQARDEFRVEAIRIESGDPNSEFSQPAAIRTQGHFPFNKVEQTSSFNALVAASLLYSLPLGLTSRLGAQVTCDFVFGCLLNGLLVDIFSPGKKQERNRNRIFQQVNLSREWSKLGVVTACSFGAVSLYQSWAKGLPTSMLVQYVAYQMALIASNLFKVGTAQALKSERQEYLDACAKWKASEPSIALLESTPADPLSPNRTRDRVLRGRSKEGFSPSAALRTLFAQHSPRKEILPVRQRLFRGTGSSSSYSS